tara:strand:+ start:270 stop:3650 length:3381 start_codon:yes stop_codon:yes gene_type:complete
LNTFQNILSKLEQFIRKYYTNELIKGAILFFAIGLLYLLATLLIEHFLWLSQTGRTILFWAFVIAEVALFARFIAFPLAKLFKLQKGIDFAQASRIIGNHFPQVNDKLLNLLQLKQNKQESELLLASIEQKSLEMQPIPFVNAVNFKQNLKYLKYAAIPVVIVLLFAVTGNTGIFSGSYERVVNYNVAYEPPAPFTFYVLNESLEALENKPYVLNVRVAGDFIPETASILYNNETYFLQQTALGQFQYTFSQPTEALNFRLQANNVTSKPYMLNVVKVPTLVSFEMELDYPRYTKRTNEILKSTGNATVPEGTTIKWKLNTRETNKVKLNTQDSVLFFNENKPLFELSKPVYSKFDYSISTSNEVLEDYENLAFSINVIKDQFPEITVEAKQDSLNSQITYFFGRVSDDYGLTKLQLVYFPSGNDKNKAELSLPVNRGNFDQFLHAFPGDLPLEEGREYSYYFEVFDNDAINAPKSTKSSTFSFRKLTQDELEKQQLKEQQETIQGLDKTIQEMEKQSKDLEELSRMQKEKNELNWNDKQKLEEFLKRQKLQEEMMKKFSEKAKENLENFQKENKENDPQKEELQKRFDENEERLQENEKLLDELEKLQEKIAEEELFEKLEELSKQNKKQKRNLEQLLELTKRYYVEKKTQKLAEELEKLAEKQEALSNEPKENNTKEKQEELNKEFEDYKEEMEELREENEQLKSPMDIPDNKAKEEEVKQEQQEATQKLEQQLQEGAQEKQKKAAEKMKEMSQQMQMQMAAGASEGQQEDIEMLRQILDNLVIYSLSQEYLMEDFKESRYGNPLFGKKLVRQSELKQNFQHVDDSLFSLALRNPMVGTVINDLIEEVHYNIDKSTEELAENRIRNGVASQQYALTGANELAVLLGDALNNMQMQMQMGMGQGEGGQGKGFQLPDIIKQQESLNEKMEQGTSQGEEGEQGEQQGEGQGQGDGEGEGEGNTGSDGDGEGGKSGDGNKDGEGSEGLESEKMSEMLFEIYKQQQLLRMKLEEKLRQEGLPSDARNLIRQMEQVEQELLERGFNQQTLRKMNDIKHQLLKLEKAAFQQGEDEKRQGRTNEKDFQSPSDKLLENAKKYFNNVEILNRQQLPLRPVYRQKVQEYFTTSDD